MPYFSISSDMYSYIDKIRYMLTCFTWFKSWNTPFENITARIPDTCHSLSRVAWPSISQFPIHRALEPLIKTMCFVRVYRACKLTRGVNIRWKLAIFVAIGTFTWPVGCCNRCCSCRVLCCNRCPFLTYASAVLWLYCERSEFFCHRFFSPTTEVNLGGIGLGDLAFFAIFEKNGQKSRRHNYIRVSF